MVKRPKPEKKKKQGGHIDQMVEFGDKIEVFIESERTEQPYLQIAVGLLKRLRVKVRFSQMTDKGDHIPAGHQDAEQLKIAPAPTGEGGTPDIPKKISEGENVVQVRHLVHIHALGLAMHL